MKTIIFCKDFQINSVPMETVLLDPNGKQKSCILLDDIKEKRWKITFKVNLAFRMTGMDYAGLNFFKGGDFPDDCFEDKEGFPVPQFRAHIMEVEDSQWIKKLKKSLKKDSESANYLEKARHFLIPCYDYIIEIIAWDFELEEMK